MFSLRLLSAKHCSLVNFSRIAFNGLKVTEELTPPEVEELKLLQSFVLAKTFAIEDSMGSCYERWPEHSELSIVLSLKVNGEISDPHAGYLVADSITCPFRFGHTFGPFIIRTEGCLFVDVAGTADWKAGFSSLSRFPRKFAFRFGQMGLDYKLKYASRVGEHLSILNYDVSQRGFEWVHSVSSGGWILTTKND